ncbi:MAG TPA: hypothetical protein VK031_00065 [Tissierellaceae bacterium]|nr:hypothetical protein [Tissierellaceae bacterium]
MRKQIQKIVESIFSLSLIIAILGGGVIFCMFIIGIIIGGSTGESLAVSASKVVMPYFIRSAAIAVLCGLISFYTTGKHTLSLDEEEKELAEN